MCEFSPERSWINNVEYFHNLCKKISHQKLIYMSSASVYGNSDIISTESNNVNLNPIKNYDLQKTVIDIIANKYILNGKNIIGLRLGTVNGSSPYTRQELMLNSMVKNSIEDKKIHIKNLEMRRSILGINDLMRAIKLIIDKDCNSGQYNLSSFTMTVNDLANCVSKICGSKIEQHPSDTIFYSFEMSTKKFEQHMNFTFNDDPNTIIIGLLNNHDNTTYSIRDNDADFRFFM